ncbi:DinB family protein [Kribbella sp. NBC_01245]|uniref:ankyrin repeat domain-containing protein n=1 Tax=Kribbella sp. NBC_01245 TaxID=2903578 RepID=UPI002E2B436C|nr:ankyrin repeat domain-containing protein [Kribbella sp. NBC_01245]
MTKLSQNLLDLSDFAWQRLRPRVEGMTDEEYFWEPVAGCWTVRKTADGSFRADDHPIPPDPPPFTTLAWRITHIIDILQAERTATWFGHKPRAEDGVPPVPGSAAEAVRALDHAYEVWRRRLAALSQDDFDRQMGEIAGQYGEYDGMAFALHILDELIHHGAEVGVVRDLYRAQQPEDPSVVALLNGDQTADVERVREQRPALIAEAAAGKRWEAVPLLVELGFDVNARDHADRTAAHLAAGTGELDVLRLLVEHGADLAAEDPEFHATPLGWAQWSNQAAAADFLVNQVKLVGGAPTVGG